MRLFGCVDDVLHCILPTTMFTCYRLCALLMDALHNIIRVTPHIVYPCLVRSATRSGLQGPNWLVLTPKSCYLISASRPHRVVASWALNLISQFGVHGSSLTIVGSTATQHAGVFDFEVAPGKCAEAYQILLGYASLWH
eukprot:m.263611 g.263611  ORF g.263611 m.263611 type:complete len:139 (+) comp15604_c1_seq3:2716-3132(+)